MRRPIPSSQTAGLRPLSTWSVAGAFVLLSLLLASWVWVSDRFFGHASEHPEASFPGSGLLGGWIHFDASWYRSIAEDGYRLVDGQSNVAFFPFYPLVMRSLSGVFASSYGAGMAITFTAGLLGVVLFWTWTADRLPTDARRYALALLLVYPYVWYLVGAVYADALFLVATLAAFLALERSHTLTAGVLGALAAATRPVGPAVVIALAVRQLERRGALRTTTRVWRGRSWAFPVGVEWSKLRASDALVLVSAVGFAAYSGYLWVRWGDPLLFSTVQKYWNQSNGPVTWFKLHLAGITVLRLRSRWLYIIGCSFQGGLALGSLYLVGRIRRRFGWGYATLVVFLMGIPVIGSKDFQGLGRYLLAAFPVFAWAGAWLADQPRGRRRAILGGSAVSLLVWSHLFARGYYVA